MLTIPTSRFFLTYVSGYHSLLMPAIQETRYTLQACYRPYPRHFLRAFSTLLVTGTQYFLTEVLFSCDFL